MGPATVSRSGVASVHFIPSRSSANRPGKYSKPGPEITFVPLREARVPLREARPRKVRRSMSGGFGKSAHPTLVSARAPPTKTWTASISRFVECLATLLGHRQVGERCDFLTLQVLAPVPFRMGCTSHSPSNSVISKAPKEFAAQSITVHMAVRPISALRAAPFSSRWVGCPHGANRPATGRH